MSSALFLFHQTAVAKKRLILDLRYVKKNICGNSPLVLKIGKHFRTISVDLFLYKFDLQNG